MRLTRRLIQQTETETQRERQTERKTQRQTEREREREREREKVKEREKEIEGARERERKRKRDREKENILDKRTIQRSRFYHILFTHHLVFYNFFLKLLVFSYSHLIIVDPSVPHTIYLELVFPIDNIDK